MKIYTKTGDKGITSLFTGDRVNKHHPLIEALGAVDECNSAIGAAVSLLPSTAEIKTTRIQLETIQHALFDIGAALATPRTKASEKKIEKTRFDSEETALLEKWIDQMDESLPVLRTFILPGGHPSGAMLHLARGLVRRAERIIIPLFEQGDVTNAVLIYLNRLSDYLFVASRYVNNNIGVPETPWEQNKKH